MKRMLVLGAGTAGTTVVNKLRPRLDKREWDITIVDQDALHHYHPGYLPGFKGSWQHRLGDWSVGVRSVPLPGSSSRGSFSAVC